MRPIHEGFWLFFDVLANKMLFQDRLTLGVFGPLVVGPGLAQPGARELCPPAANSGIPRAYAQGCITLFLGAGAVLRGNSRPASAAPRRPAGAARRAYRA